LFQSKSEKSIDCDDLLFFVRKKHVRSSSRTNPQYDTEIEVFRKDSRKLPIGDPSIDWEESVYLNLIIHQFDYSLTLAICTRTSPKELQILKKFSQKVYASPSKRKMDSKGDSEGKSIYLYYNYLLMYLIFNFRNNIPPYLLYDRQF
jgi:hypothetical protein